MSTNNDMYRNMDPVQWRQEVKKEINNQSDRGVAIICASILDEQLKYILKQFMIKERDIDKDLFEGNSALSTFSSKIKACYYLGLISEDEYKNIEGIRKVRNMFAHQLVNISFENNQSIKDRCSNLYIPEKRYIPESVPMKGENGELPKLNLDPFTVDNSPKNRFVEVFYFLSSTFLIRVTSLRLEGSREKLETNMSFADELREQIEKGLKYKEQVEKTMIENQLKINSLEEKLGEKKTIFEKPEDSSHLKGLVSALDQFSYIAEVLENSYEK